LIKAIALDVDGTITDEKRRLCPSSLEAIRESEERGIPVIIVTGNILCSTRTISILLGTSGGLVAENGGVIKSSKRKYILGDIRKCQEAYEFLETRYPVRKVEYSEQRVSEIAIERDVEVEILKESLKHFDVRLYDTGFAIHITDPSVNKGSSLICLAQDLGVEPNEIMAVGDSENDLEFLEVAGIKVAVANADQELKSLADYISQKPYGDGVKEAIERFVS
jgi:phosphoglycolate phosphatase